MPDLHYEHPALAALYDLDSGWSIDRDFYLGLASGGQKRILDIGCGTGLLCNAYASLGHQVTGVDPAHAMLDVARTKPYGSHVEWIESTAQSFRSDKRFDLIIMTGNAFQVFLEDQEVLAVFETMRRPSGTRRRYCLRNTQSSCRLAGAVGQRRYPYTWRTNDPSISQGVEERR